MGCSWHFESMNCQQIICLSNNRWRQQFIVSGFVCKYMHNFDILIFARYAHANKNKKPEIQCNIEFQASTKYSGWELNPHSPYGEQDFKSCVSTNSTTRVKFTGNIFTSGRKKKQITKAICFTSESGRPGSNRPPRPWQGRALPNELLPHFLKELINFGMQN